MGGDDAVIFGLDAEVAGLAGRLRMAWLKVPPTIDERDLALALDRGQEGLDRSPGRSGRRRAARRATSGSSARPRPRPAAWRSAARCRRRPRPRAAPASLSRSTIERRDDRRAASGEPAEIELVGVPAQHAGGVLQAQAAALSQSATASPAIARRRGDSPRRARAGRGRSDARSAESTQLRPSTCEAGAAQRLAMLGQHLAPAASDSPRPPDRA